MNIADPIPLAYSVLEWTVRIVMLLTVTTRRSPEEARTWLLFALFLPIPAGLLFLIVGRSRAPRWRRRRFAEARTLLSLATKQIEHSHHCSRPKVSGNLAQAASLIKNLSQFPVLGGNSISLMPDYQEMIDQLVQDIERATDHIHLTTYIFAADETGARIISALLQAAARGIECRVLLDAVGSITSASEVVLELKAGGIAVERALLISMFRPRSVRADIRNHRKVVVIDGQTGYIGSQNIINETAASGLINKELVVRISGPAVLELQAVFAADWFLETGALSEQSS